MIPQACQLHKTLIDKLFLNSYIAYMRSTHTKPELVATYPLDEEEEDTSKILNSVGNYDCNNYDEPLKLLADIKPETRYTSKAVTNADYCEPISIKTPSVVNEIGVQSSGYGYTEPTIKFTQTNTDGAYDNLDLYQKDDHSSSSGEGSGMYTIIIIIIFIHKY